MSEPLHAPLLPFFWGYFRRYWSWLLVSLVSILLFGIFTAGIVGLLNPIFGEVLLGGEALDVSGQIAEAAGTGDEVKGAAQGLMERLGGPAGRVRDWASGFYANLQRRFGIEEGNGFRSPLYFAPILFVFVFLLRAITAFSSSYSFQRVGLATTTDIRNDLYSRLIQQSARFHSEHTSGELFSRVISDVTRLQAVVSSRLLDLAQQSVALVVYVVALLSIHFQLAVFCLIATPLFLIPIVRFGKGMRSTSHRSQERMADLSALLTEGIRGNRVVKAFGMEAFESERFERATEKHLKVNLRQQVLASLSSPVIESLAAVGGCVLVISVGRMIRAGSLTPELFMQFMTTLFMLYDPIRKLNRANLVLQDALASAQRVADIMAVPIDIVDEATSPPLETLEKSIHYDNVSFSYDTRDVLENFDLEIPAGQAIALVGPSGAGKSTVVNLLPRFFDPTAGSIRIDGVDIRTLPLSNLRSLIGIVTQETILFNDSVRNNIAYGRSDLSLESVREAAAAAYADEFVMELEHGYDTVIGESGAQLSGGQRQRLAIARALLKNAPILILDEATSHLDTESELLVQRAVSNLMAGRTSLVIAHRLSTVIRADRIVVMDSGMIMESGTHEQLLAQEGAYKRLYELQFKG